MERFYKKIRKENSGCWVWIAARKSENGYGCFRYNNKMIDAHRMSYILSKGVIPEGMLVCHTCDNRPCVNPDHLFLGTYKDNYEDAISKGRIIKHKFLNKHPSSSAYKKGCRCDSCVLNHRLKDTIYKRKYRERLNPII